MPGNTWETATCTWAHRVRRTCRCNTISEPGMQAASHHLTRVITHGMNADTVISDWPALTSAEVARVLQHYPQAGKPLRLEWHSPRPFSAACVMHTDAGEIFVKRHH